MCISFRKGISRLAAIWLALATAVAFALIAEAGRISVGEAESIAMAFAGRGTRLGTCLGTNAVSTARHVVDGGGAFFSVRMKDRGTVFISEEGPVVAFTEGAVDFASLEADSPLRALLERDAVVRANISALGLNGGSPYYSSFTNRISSVDDIRVSPLIKSKWSQGSAGGHNCYNYYTPNNYVCGCTATATAQIMRYFKFPTASVASVSKTCKVGETTTTLTTQGGIYDWSKMTLVPTYANYSDESWSEIGKLTSDAGIALRSEYTSGGTSAYPNDVPSVFRDVFGYSSAILFGNEDVITEAIEGDGLVHRQVGFYDRAYRQNVIAANLDAGLPVMLCVFGYEAGHVGDDDYLAGHAIVGDGYGYCDIGGEKVPYVHINMGWAGVDDAWYNIPEISTADAGAVVGDGGYAFTILDECIGNIFTNATGEIISGRVLDNDGNAVAGAEVSIDNVGIVVSNEKGIYSFIVPSGTAATLRAVSGSVTGSIDVVAGHSQNGLVGNRWGQDITLGIETGRRTVPAEFFVSAEMGEDSQGRGSSAMPYATIQYAITNGVELVAGDVIRVRPGLYHGAVETPSTSISIISTDGPTETIVDGDGRDCCYSGSANTGNLFAGFTLTNGYYYGGVFEGTVSNCVICFCTSTGQNGGGGVLGAIVYDSVIYGNEAPYGGGAAHSTLIGCTVYDNWAFYAGGGLDYSCVATNSIIWRNTVGSGNAPGNYEIYRSYGISYVPSLAYSCTYPVGFNDQGGNITNDPCFVSLDVDDWRLRSVSPCLGTALGGGNMGAWQGAGVNSHVISVELDGHGRVTPWGATVIDGGSATFTASGDHPFLGFSTNGVFATKEKEFSWQDVRADGTLTASFGVTNYFIDASGGSDQNDGLSPATPVESIYCMVQRAGSGDKVFVAPGVYDGCDWCIRGVEVTATGGPSVTIVDGGGTNRCLYANGMVYRGFTFRNGSAPTSYGGGVYGGAFVDCVISNCTSAAGGGAACASMTNCLVAGNFAQSYRSGWYWYGGLGGGAYECVLANCTVAGNSASSYGGGAYLQNSGDAINTIVASNASDSGPDYGNDVYGNGYWTMVSSLSDVDAQFRDAEHGDYRLKPMSPAFDAGTLAVVLPGNDLSGQARIWGRSVDMGCYEYHLPDATWTDPEVSTNDTDASLSGKVVSAARAEGFSAAISESIATLSDYAYLLEWASDNNVSRQAQNSSPSALLSPALGADGLIDFGSTNVVITTFSPAGTNKWTAMVSLPGYDRGKVNLRLLGKALWLEGSGSLEGGFVGGNLQSTIAPGEDGVGITTEVPESASYFIRARIR